MTIAEYLWYFKPCIVRMMVFNLEMKFSLITHVELGVYFGIQKWEGSLLVFYKYGHSLLLDNRVQD